jgi:hypothetical protein
MNGAATPAEIRGTLARLRASGESLRVRPAEERLAALGAVLEEWRSADGAPRRALALELPKAAGFSRAVVERGLDVALAGWSAPALRALYEREIGTLGRGGPHRVASGFPTTAVLLAGAIPSASLVSLLAPLALGSAVLARPAGRDPLTPALLAASLARVDRGLAAAFAVLPFDARDDRALEAFAEADCVVATGSDATVARVAARVAPPRRMVGYGHRASFAALGPEALGEAGALAAACGRLALDVALWDQLGCLSPVSLLVAGDAAAARRAGAALAEALADAERALPRGEVPAEAAARTAHERAEAELRAAAGAGAALFSGAAWTVVAEADARPRPAPLHRFVRVHPVGDAEGVARALAPCGLHLAALGTEGFGPGADALARAAAALGASRVCALGAMQAPPLAWCHDGGGVLLPLARLADLETPGGSFLQDRSGPVS